MSNPEGDKRFLLPDQLQSSTREVYNSIPEAEEGIDFSEAGKDSSYLHRQVSAGFQSVAHRERSETKQIIIEKLKELLAQSITTNQFRELLLLLADRVYVLGRRPNNEPVDSELEDPLSGDSDALSTSLQINGVKENTNGIYDPKGAFVGERILYIYAINAFANTVRSTLELGLDPLDPKLTDPRPQMEALVNPPPLVFDRYPLFKFRDFLFEWRTEHKRIYGVEPLVSNFAPNYEHLYK